MLKLYGIVHFLMPVYYVDIMVCVALATMTLFLLYSELVR